MAFNEKLEKKLKKILAKAGLDEDKIDKVIDDVEGELAEEDTPDDVDPEESAPNPESEEVEEPNEEPSEEEPQVEENPAPSPSDENGVVPGSNEEAVGGLVEGLQPEVPPQPPIPPEEEVVTPAPAPVPQIDPGQIQDLISKVEELTKARDGLLNRVASLEDALKKAGVIEGSPVVGDERPTLPESANGQGDLLKEVLAQINPK